MHVAMCVVVDGTVRMRMTILNIGGTSWCNVNGYTILISGWSKVEAGQQNYVAQSENGPLKVIGFAFLIGISEQKH